MESLRVKNLALDTKSSSPATELLSRQDEVNNWMGKTQFLERELKPQIDLMTVKETRILALDIGLIKANEKLSELNAKYKELQAEHISQSDYILEQQTTIAKVVDESGQLQKDFKKVQDFLASVEQTCAKKDEEILHLRSKLQQSKLLVKTQRGIIDVAENKLRE